MVKKHFGRQGQGAVMTFSERVVAIALRIPKGKVLTYGGLARLAGGGAMASQSITTILGRAYDRGEKNIPFHRIVYADGRVWIDEKHRDERMEKYSSEGIVIGANGKIVDFEEKIFDPHET